VKAEKYLDKPAYRLAIEGRLLLVEFQPLVVLRLKLRIVRLAKRIHVELKKYYIPQRLLETRYTHGLHLRDHTLCSINVVQFIILTWNEIVGVVRVIFVVVGRGR
jgi:hypothetical protein